MVADVPAPVDLLVAAVAAARKGAKEKGVHQVRVTTRRLDAWLLLAGMWTLRADLRWLRQAAAASRDLDVLLAREWPPEVRARLKEERAAARHALAVDLAAPRTTALLLALRLLPPIPRVRAERGSRRLVRALLKGRVDPTDPAAVHARRRKLRRVRYARELLGHRDEALVALQDVLGEVSDLWLAMGRAPDPAADAHALALPPALAAAEAAWRDTLPLLESLR